MVTTGRSRRFWAGLTSLTLIAGLAAPAVLAPSAQAIEPTTTKRVFGADRFGTAAAAAEAAFPGGSSTVVLATGIDFPDALAAGGLAGALDAPVLLVTTDAIPGVTAQTIVDLGVDTAFVVGGVGAISENVVQALEADEIDVTRVDGADRFETAANVARQIDATDDNNPLTTGDGIGTVDGEPTGIVVTGLDFADAVSSSQVAFAGRFPILPITKSVNPEAIETVIDELGITNVLVVGGSGVIPNARIDELQADTAVTTAVRLAGQNRWGTSVDVAEWAIENLAFDPSETLLANGLSFADALGGAALAGTGPNPLVLTAPSVVPDETRGFLRGRANQIDAITALGGTAAISAATLTEAATEAVLDTNEVLVVSPPESSVEDESANFADDSGARNFTATGLEPGEEYVIALVDPTTVGNADGATVFTSYTLSDDASTAIESVNGGNGFTAGSGNESVEETGTADANGQLTFRIDATAPDSVIPVVYQDSNGDGQLNLSDSKPTEVFGTGGRTSWLPDEAPDDDFDLTVTEVNRDANYFLADIGNQANPDVRTFFYEGSDRYALGNGTPNLSSSAFENALTRGDEVRVDYNPNAQSLFRLDTDLIPDISGLSAAVSGAAGSQTVTVTWTASTQPDVVYTVYRDGRPVIDDQGTQGQFGTLDRDQNGNIVEQVVSALGAETTRTFSDTVTGPVRYFVVPEGGVTGTEDTLRDDPEPFEDTSITFITNEVAPDVDLAGRIFGSAVSLDADLTTISSQGDVWRLHFNKPVAIAANASIGIAPTPGSNADPVVFRNGTSRSTWTKDPSDANSVLITLGEGANTGAFVTYATNDDGAGGAPNIMAISGLSSASETLTLSDLQDRILENNGPELMPDSTTCRAGAEVCEISFNEPVTAASAENESNYEYSSNGDGAEALGEVSLGSDGRTITLSINLGSIDNDDTLDDNSNPPVSAVTDAGNGQTWSQPGTVTLQRS